MPTPRVVELIAHHARQAPHAPACVTPEETLAHGELDRWASALAHDLVRLGVRPGHVVLVQLPRGTALAAAVIGVMKARGVLCVVDPGYPRERVGHMWRASGARVALVDPAAEVPSGTGVSSLHHPEASRARATPSPATTPPTPDDLAYAVFTSGSTGGPKAVAVPHRSLDNLIGWTLAATSDAPLRTLQFAPLGFDVFLQEAFTAWCSGGCLYLPADSERGDLQRLLGRLAEWRIQRLFVPPVALTRLADLANTLGPLPAELREVAAAGEALRITPGVRALFAALPGARLHNHYGPAETHVALAHTLTGPPALWPDLPPIGHPLPGTTAHLRPAGPDGAAAELCLAGVGLADGYLGDPARTAERFTGLDTDRGTVRAYRTGDLVRRGPGGVLEYVGRVDDQVKIRGYRVEPGEVEAALAGHPAVQECAVTAWQPSPDAERHLVAHVVPRPGRPLDAAALRAHLSALLPDHMVPRHVLRATALPVSPNGKIDRRILPTPPTSASTAEPADGSPEAAVRRIWSDLLGTEVPDTAQDFRDLGGTSLSAAVVVTRLHHRFGVRIDLREFLRTPTVDALCTLILERTPR